MAAFSWFRSAASNNQKQSENNKEPFFKKGSDTAMESESTTSKPSAFFSPATIQPKLTIGEPNDKYEQEADAMANMVVSETKHASTPPPIQTKCNECLPDGNDMKVGEKEEEGKVDMKELEGSEIQRKPIFESNKDAPDNTTVRRKCNSCGKELEQTVQTKSEGNASPGTSNLSSRLNTQKGKGGPLPESTRSDMESGFGTDFQNVKIHTDQQALDMNQSLGSQAFTHGSDVYFNRGKYSLETDKGRHLLTHVVQQGGENATSYKIQRQTMENIDPLDDPRMHQDGAPNANSGPIPSGCPPHFCQPSGLSESYSRLLMMDQVPILLAGIAAAVSPRVVPLWSNYLFGGTSSIQNLTPSFGSDFEASPTTARTNAYLYLALRRVLTTGGYQLASEVERTIDINFIISSEIAAINSPGGANEMNFSIPRDIPGNLAGGIGANQTSSPVGANPSPINDERIVSGVVTTKGEPDGSLTVTPDIWYTVKDTIDLCPGNCGSSAEQIATVPMSQYEADGVSGDVPYTVEFRANIAPFSVMPVITPPSPVLSPSPGPGVVSASALRIRTRPDVNSPIAGMYFRGDSIAIIGETTGSEIEGNDIWYETERGYVSARYVTI